MRNGKQTGFFIYDVWDPSAGPRRRPPDAAEHDGTDIFCSSQLVLPAERQHLPRRRRQLLNGATTNTGNNNSNVFTPVDNTLARGNNMNRARWYSSSTTLLNGEIYIQGGSGGADLPEIRGTNGVYRLLPNVEHQRPQRRTSRATSSRPTAASSASTPAGKMYYISPGGNGMLTMAGQLPGATSWTSSAVDVPPGPHPADGWRLERRARHRHQRSAARS